MKPPSPPPSQLASASVAVSFIISQINSSDRATSCKALKQLESVIITPPKRASLGPHIDQLVQSILMKMKMNFSTPLTNANDPQSQKEVMDMSKALLSCLVVLFSEPSLAVLVSQETLTEVEREVMSYLVDSRLLKLEDAAQLIRSINYFMLRVCENSEKTALFSSLLQVVQQSLNPDGSTTKLTEITLKCIWKPTKQLAQHIPSIKVDQLLKDVHMFLKSYTTMVPTPRADDMVYRTVRTIIFILTDTLGVKIFDHFTLIEDPKRTKLYQTIQKNLAKKGLSLAKEAHTSSAPSTSGTNGGFMQAAIAQVSQLPPGGSRELSQIMKKVAERSTAKEALRELYEFTKRYPMFDLNEFIKDYSDVFQSYIRKGMRGIEAELAGQGSYDPSQFTTDDYQKHLQRFEELKLRASQVFNKTFDVEESSVGKRPQRSIARKENKPADGAPQVNPASTGGGASGSSAAASAKPGVDIKDLRRRLDLLKGTITH